MRNQLTQVPEKILIVIPDWGLAWYIYCLEHAVELSKSGKEVSILDLSNLNPTIFRRHFWKFALSLAQKNRLSDIKQILSKIYNIKLIVTTLPRLINSPNWMTKERNEIFLAAMASKYFNLTGRRDTQLEEIDKKVVEIERYFFNSTIRLIIFLQNQLNFNEITTVNGRYVVDGAVVQACKESQMKCILIESASSNAGKYAVYKISPQDIPSVQEMHKELWEGAGSEREEIAEKGLQKKLSGNDSPGFNYRANFTEKFSQDQELVTAKIAVFFPSSDREFAIFPEFIYQESFGGSQSEAFLAFSRVAKANGYQVIVRVHPVNSKAPKELQERFADIEDGIWGELCRTSGAEIIESRSRISSYDLIDKANLCATYASSISIECILSRKPTLILGESEISSCVPEICAFNEIELLSKFNEQIPLIDRVALYPYAYWLESGGKKLELFEFVSDHEVYFETKLVNEYRLWIKPIIALKNKIEALIGN